MATMALGGQLGRRSAVATAVMSLIIVNAGPADAAVCIRGKPTVKVVSQTEAAMDCGCFASDPAGTEIFAFNQISVSVQTPRTEFSRSFDPDSTLMCDAEHVYVSSPAVNGYVSEKHAYPLYATTITSGTGGEQAVLPAEHPDSHLQRLIDIGQAHLSRTL